jgi:hypothetical protein
MTYQDYVGKTDNIKTIFVAGIYSALSVDTASDELKLKWIREEYAKLEAELKKVDAIYDSEDEIGDPFADEVK